MRSFDQIYKEEKRKIYGMILSKIYPDKETAEELTDNVLLKISQNLANFNSEFSSFDTWLFNITKNEIIDYFRSKRCKKKMQTNNVSDYVNSDGDEYFQFESILESDSEINESELFKKVNNILNGTKNIVQKKVCILRFFDDMDYKDIANELNIPINTVKIHISRMRTKLQEKLHTEYAI